MGHVELVFVGKPFFYHWLKTLCYSGERNLSPLDICHCFHVVLGIFWKRSMITSDLVFGTGLT